MILKCESCIESWIFPTFFDWLLFIPGPRPLIWHFNFCSSTAKLDFNQISHQAAINVWGAVLFFIAEMDRYITCDFQLYIHITPEQCHPFFHLIFQNERVWVRIFLFSFPVPAKKILDINYDMFTCNVLYFITSATN